MALPQPTEFHIANGENYRENYANSVQIRTSVWDFFLAFGLMQPGTGNSVTVNNFEGIFLSPQQAKALSLMLRDNVANYEQTFGEIKLDAQHQLAPEMAN